MDTSTMHLDFRPAEWGDTAAADAFWRLLRVSLREPRLRSMFRAFPRKDAPALSHGGFAAPLSNDFVLLFDPAFADEPGQETRHGHAIAKVQSGGIAVRTEPRKPREPAGRGGTFVMADPEYLFVPLWEVETNQPFCHLVRAMWHDTDGTVISEQALETQNLSPAQMRAVDLAAAETAATTIQEMFAGFSADAFAIPVHLGTLKEQAERWVGEVWSLALPVIDQVVFELILGHGQIAAEQVETAIAVLGDFGRPILVRTVPRIESFERASHLPAFAIGFDADPAGRNRRATANLRHSPPSRRDGCRSMPSVSRRLPTRRRPSVRISPISEAMPSRRPSNGNPPAKPWVIRRRSCATSSPNAPNPETCRNSKMGFISVSIDLSGSTLAKQAIVAATEKKPSLRAAMYADYLRLLYATERDFYRGLMSRPLFRLNDLYLVKMIGDEFWWIYECGEDAKRMVAVATAFFSVIMDLFGQGRHLTLAMDDCGNGRSPSELPIRQFNLPLKACIDFIDDATEINRARYEFLKDVIMMADGDAAAVYRVDARFMAPATGSISALRHRPTALESRPGGTTSAWRSTASSA